MKTFQLVSNKSTRNIKISLFWNFILKVKSKLQNIIPILKMIRKTLK